MRTDVDAISNDVSSISGDVEEISGKVDNKIFIVNPEDETTTKQYIPRETLRRVSTPQAYEYEELDAAYHEAFEKEIGIYGSSYTNTMWVELGKTLHFAVGSDKNIKLTTKDDLEIFKSYINANKDNN